MKQIKDIEELKKLASNGGLDCFIRLNGGCRSSKHINYDGEKFWVWNSIDDTEQSLTECELLNEENTNIGKALKNGALYQD